MRTSVRVEGFRELEAQLERLKPAAGRGALRRAGTKAMRPMAELARSLAPEETGELKRSIVVSAKARGEGGDVGLAEYAATLRGGGSRGEALSALRGARRAARGRHGTALTLFMGPAQARSRDEAIKRIVQEFGAEHMAPNPYMRPAWDRDHGAMLERLKADLWAEIERTIARAAPRGNLRS